MAIYSRHDVVRVPFPFTDGTAEKNRPALILSDHAWFNAQAAHSVMAMITSAQHARWPLDVPISDLTAAGLPAASLVRFKLFTLDHRLIRVVLGHLSNQDAGRVTKSVRKLFI
jgi:mRNA interferase MazF